MRSLNRNGFTLYEVLVILLVVCASLVLSMAIFGGYTVSEGSRVGTIQKFSYTGIVCKTYEGELLLGGLGSGATGSPVANTWGFSVRREDTDLIKRIETARDSGERVSLSYKQRLASLPWHGSTVYFIEELKTVMAAQPNPNQ